MSPGVITIRVDICHDCPAPCAWQRDATAHANPCAACPSHRWGQWDCASATTSAAQPSLPAPAGVTSPAGLRGLGDLVAFVAEPIARAIGMDKAKCGCAQRRQALNKLLPFG